MTQDDQAYSVLRSRFLVSGSLFQTSIQSVMFRTARFPLVLVGVLETCQGRLELQELLRKCLISHLMGDDSSYYIKSFCLVATEPMLGLTTVVLDPGCTTMEELMAK